MANQYINKVIYGNETLIDLTGDTVTAGSMLSGKTAHDKSGATITGNIASKGGATYNVSTTDQTIAAGQYLSAAQTIRAVTTSGIAESNIKAGVTVEVGDAGDSDRIVGVTGTYTSDATATADEILLNKTAYVNGSKLTGTMPNRGKVTHTISTLASYTIPNGFHDGSGSVSVDSTDIEAGNIKSGKTILGVAGTYTGEAATTQEKTFTPTALNPAKGTSVDITADAGYDFLSKVTINAIPYSETDNSAGGKTVTIGASAS